jgi:hypothetical protein
LFELVQCFSSLFCIHRSLGKISSTLEREPTNYLTLQIPLLSMCTEAVIKRYNQIEIKVTRAISQDGKNLILGELWITIYLELKARRWYFIDTGSSLLTASNEGRLLVNEASLLNHRIRLQRPLHVGDMISNTSLRLQNISNIPLLYTRTIHSFSHLTSHS